MKKPLISPDKLKRLVIDVKATLARLSKVLDAHDDLIPVKGKKKRKGCLAQTWNSLQAIVMDLNKKYKSGLAPGAKLKVTQTFLANRIKKSSRTVARHLDLLLEKGILVEKQLSQELFPGKDRMINCTELQLNPDLVLYQWCTLKTPVTFQLFMGYLESNLSTEELKTEVDKLLLTLISSFSKPPET